MVNSVSSWLSASPPAIAIPSGLRRSASPPLPSASGKQLTTIYISHGDPDYYFGLDTLTAAFPKAKVLGLVLLLPFTRKLLAGKMRQRAEEAAMRQRAFADDLQPRGGPAPRQPLGREGDVIEGEFEHRDPK